jgi:hypothetical protein
MKTRVQKVRHDPQLSLGLLGEYMVAGFVRKRSILRSAKFPRDYIGAQYDPAQRAASRYLAGGGGDRERLARDIEGLLVGSDRSRWYRQRQALCEQAIRCVFDLEAALKLQGLEVEVACDPAHRLDISGVSIVVMPDVLVRGEGRKGAFLGAMKFRYVKTRPVDGRWAAYSATILHQFVEERLAVGGAGVERRQCRFVDVFAGKVFEAPGSYKERRNEVEAACWEIKQLWPTIDIGDGS